MKQDMKRENKVKEPEKTAIGYEPLVYAVLLKKYIEHIMHHESINYLSEYKLKGSGVKFTEIEINELRRLATEI